MDYGIIGPGKMGLEHIQSINHIDGSRVVAVADPVESSRQEGVAVAGGAARAFADHRALLDSRLCDAVVISSPNHTHGGILLDAIEARMPTLVEKPPGITIEECRRALSLQEKLKTPVAVGLEYRWMAPIEALLAQVRQGALGTPWMVSVREHRAPLSTKVDRWNEFNDTSGGTLLELGSHFFDLMALLLDDRPTVVYATGARNVGDGDGAPDMIDNAYVVIDWEGGARSALDVCTFADGAINETEIAVVGDRAKADVFVTDGIVRLSTRGRDVVTSEVQSAAPFLGAHFGSIYLQHLDFIEAVEMERRPTVGLEEGMLAVAMGVAGHRSIEQNRPVIIDEVLGWWRARGV